MRSKLLFLSKRLAITDFKQRNERSFLGIIWYLLVPLLMGFLLYLIFKDRLGNNIENYILYLFIGIVIFNFFQKTTTEAIDMIRQYNYLIKSIPFPKEAIPLALTIRNSISHIIEIGILILISNIFFNANIISLFLYIPLFFCIAIFIYGLSLIMASMNVRYDDFGHVWRFTTQLIWLATPIFYSIEGQLRLEVLNTLNPLFHFITAAREIIIYNHIPEIQTITFCLLFTIGSISLGSIIFNKEKKHFAEKI